MRSGHVVTVDNRCRSEQRRLNSAIAISTLIYTQPWSGEMTDGGGR